MTDYEQFDPQFPYKEYSIPRYSLEELLKDNEIIPPKSTIIFVGPGKRNYRMTDSQAGSSQVEGPMDGLTFLVGYLEHPLVFIERPADVKEGGARANEKVFDTLRNLGPTGYSNFQVIWEDMNSPNIANVRKDISGSVTVIDNKSHKFWGPARQAQHERQAEQVMQQYRKMLFAGDRLICVFNGHSDDLKLAMQYIEIGNQLGFISRFLRTKDDIAIPKQMEKIGIDFDGNSISVNAGYALIMDVANTN